MTTLIVEDGTGVDGANSYISLTDAATILTRYGFTTFTGTDDVLSNWLIQATFMLDRVYGEDYLGTAYYTDSPVLQPRFPYMDNNARFISGGIHAAIPEATAVLAYLLKSGTVEQFPNFNNRNLLRDQSVKVGDITSESTFFTRTRHEKYEDMLPIEQILKPCTYQRSTSIRMSR